MVLVIRKQLMMILLGGFTACRGQEEVVCVWGVNPCARVNKQERAEKKRRGKVREIRGDELRRK